MIRFRIYWYMVLLIYFEKRKDITNESSLADCSSFTVKENQYYNILKTVINIKISRNMHFGFCLSCKKVIIVEELMTVGAHSWYNRKDSGAEDQLYAIEYAGRVPSPRSC